MVECEFMAGRIAFVRSEIGIEGCSVLEQAVCLLHFRFLMLRIMQTSSFRCT